jgi:hypothetical protein
MPYLIAVQASLVGVTPDDLKDLSPPGAVLLGGTNGIAVVLEVSAGDAQANPHYWDGTSWINPGADVVGGLNKVSASFATVPVANGQFYQRSGGPRWWAILKTGAGTVSRCTVAEADI